ncbi:MAG TPA: hypothetical protein VID05_05240 [Acidimicrobiales bacterium]|jgi:hypothetical protein
MSGDVIVGAFSSADQANSAIVALERAGVDSGHVRVANAPGEVGRDQTRLADQRMSNWLGRRVVKGVVLGALIGAGIAIVVVFIAMSNPGIGVLIGVGILGAIAGSVAGGYIWVIGGVPRSSDAFDSYLLAHDEEVCVAVTLADVTRLGAISDVLTTEGATSVQRVARSKATGAGA